MLFPSYQIQAVAREHQQDLLRAAEWHNRAAEFQRAEPAWLRPLGAPTGLFVSGVDGAIMARWNAVPAAPISVTVTARTANSVNLRWNLGDSTVPTSYRVKTMKLDASASTTVTTTSSASILLNGLETGAAFAVWVAAGSSRRTSYSCAVKCC